MATAKKYGTFGGVFTPSLLTILGVIMYLRLPWIVGHAGLWTTIGIILVAHVISISSGLSVASIATDKKVGSGGSYYIISRSLGLPIGGTLGWALFAGLSLSISLYIIGFTDVLLGAVGVEATIENIRLWGSIFLFGVLVITLISTSLTIKTQYLILAIVLISLLSLFLGKHSFTPSAPQLSSLPDSPSWITLFAIFFPAATGFQAGISMSGDLKNPGRAIPLGTILSIVVAMAIYLGLAIFFALTVDRVELVNNPKIIFETALSPQLVIAGVLGTTLSSALGSILAAPRILQAVAKDRIAPSLFAKGYGNSNEPRNALIFSYLIAQGGVLIGELNEVARVVSIFFIISYGFLNLTYAIESWASSDFRPSFKIPRSISIVGALFSLVLMIQLDLPSLLLAAALLAALFFYFRSKDYSLSSGDSQMSLWLSVVKSGLLKLAKGDMKSRNWRPNIILFSGGAQKRPHLPRLALDMVGRLGIFTNFEILSDPSIKSSAEIYLDKVYEEGGFITRRHRSKDLYEGIGLISSIYGFSGFQPNTLMLGWPKEPLSNPSFITLLHNLNRHDFNIALLKYNAAKDFGNHRLIDFWWRGGIESFTLALHLIRFLTASTNWRRSEVRFLAISPRATLNSRYQSTLESILREYRVKATVKIVNSLEHTSEHSTIAGHSSQRDLTIVDIPFIGKETKEIVSQIDNLASHLGTTLFINGQSSLEKITPLKSLLSIDHLQNVSANRFQEREKEGSPSPLLTIEIPLEERLKDLLYQTIIQIDKGVEELYSATFQELTLKFNTYFKKIEEELSTPTKEGHLDFGSLNNTYPELIEPSIAELERGFVNYLATIESAIVQLPLKREISTILQREIETISHLYRGYREHFIQFIELLREIIESSLKGVGEEPISTIVNSRVEDFYKCAEESRDSLRSTLCESLNQIVVALGSSKSKMVKSRNRRGRRNLTLTNRVEQLSQEFLQFGQEQWSLFEYDLLYIELKLKIATHINHFGSSIKERLQGGILKQIAEIEQHIAHNSSPQNISNFPLSFNIQNVENPYASLGKSISTLLDSLPDSIVVVEGGEEKRLYIKKPATYHIENELLGRVARHSNTLVGVIGETLQKLRNLQKLSAFYTKSSEEVEANNGVAHQRDKELITNILEGFRRGREEIETELAHNLSSLRKGLNLAFEALFNRDGAKESSKIRDKEHGGRVLFKRFRDIWEALLEKGRLQLAKLLYNTSEGSIKIALAERGREKSPLEGARFDREILELLPFFYLNLFRDHWGVNREFWVDLKGKLQEGNRAIERFMFGRKGAILISGERGAGKSSLAKQLTELNFTPNRLIRILPQREATSQVSLFEELLFEALRAKVNYGPNSPTKYQGGESLEALLAENKERLVVVIEDLEMWWERRPSGAAVVERLVELIQIYGKELLFVVTVNSHALKVIDSITSIGSWLSLHIEAPPFSARMLKELILARHKAGGLKLVMEGKGEGQMREWDWARLFNRLFKLSEGNPKEAINLWLASINNVAGETIFLDPPTPFREEQIATVGREEGLILYQLVLHRRFSIQHLSSILLTDSATLSSKLKELAQREILIEESPAIYSINPTLYHSLVKKLVALRLL
ncbi:MAG: hypothetical protein WC960_03175 [Bacteroidales bacterium]